MGESTSPVVNDASSCDALLTPAPEGELVDIGVTNLRGEPLALGSPSGSFSSDHVMVESLDDASPSRGLTNSCGDGLTCDRILANPSLGCPPAGMTTLPFVIDPGERVVVQWRARLESIAPVAPECCASEQACPARCLSPRLAEPGQYRATLAFTALTSAEADVCREEPELADCYSKVNSEELEQVALEFALGEGEIELEIE